jgi:hypothetical protein
MYNDLELKVIKWFRKNPQETLSLVDCKVVLGTKITSGRDIPNLINNSFVKVNNNSDTPELYLHNKAIFDLIKPQIIEVEKEIPPVTRKSLTSENFDFKIETGIPVATKASTRQSKMDSVLLEMQKIPNCSIQGSTFEILSMNRRAVTLGMKVSRRVVGEGVSRLWYLGQKE